jgi:hypothetical protein
MSKCSSDDQMLTSGRILVKSCEHPRNADAARLNCGSVQYLRSQSRIASNSNIVEMRRWGPAWRIPRPKLDFRKGSKTEAAARHGNVCFTPETGHGSRVYEYTP